MYQQVNAATAEAKAATTALDENMEAMKHNFLLRGFYKKRGYEDQTELKKHEISGLPKETAIKNSIMTPNRFSISRIQPSSKIQNF